VCFWHTVWLFLDTNCIGADPDILFTVKVRDRNGWRLGVSVI
jgi:hypothetical protein